MGRFYLIPDKKQKAGVQHVCLLYYLYKQKEPALNGRLFLSIGDSPAPQKQSTGLFLSGGTRRRTRAVLVPAGAPGRAFSKQAIE